MARSELVWHACLRYCLGRYLDASVRHGLPLMCCSSQLCVSWSPCVLVLVWVTNMSNSTLRHTAAAACCSQSPTPSTHGLTNTETHARGHTQATTRRRPRMRVCTWTWWGRAAAWRTCTCGTAATRSTGGCSRGGVIISWVATVVSRVTVCVCNCMALAPCSAVQGWALCDPWLQLCFHKLKCQSARA